GPPAVGSSSGQPSPASGTPTTTTTPTAASQTSRPAGLAAAGNSKTNCLFVGSYPWQAQLAADEQSTSMTYNCLETYANADPTWADWVSPWVTSPSVGYAEWLQASPETRTMVLTIDLIPDAVSDNADPATWEGPCDAGDYDGYATELGENLVASGFEYSIIRLGAEANGGWENDFVGTTTAEQSDWAACFAQEVTAMRAVPGAHFLFDWNVNSCYEAIPFASYYPGDAYVDVIGIDQYDASCTTTLPGPTAAGWNELAAEPGGLDAFAAFAAQVGKPMSIPEWGLESSPNGDDPYYVNGIGGFVADNDVSFECYFDSGDDGILQMGTDLPQSLAAYQEQFGN
ncbi:MAG TPA: glycosyl hydrolase, partial [Acidimicrobiales bacterium]|nr:glycosyl hydrolase [Acidimicrobiales bacterium]